MVYREEKFQSTTWRICLPVDDHLDSNVLKDEPEEAKQSWLPLHVAQASFPAHWDVWIWDLVETGQDDLDDDGDATADCEWSLCWWWRWWWYCQRNILGSFCVLLSQKMMMAEVWHIVCMQPSEMMLLTMMLIITVSSYINFCVLPSQMIQMPTMQIVPSSSELRSQLMSLGIDQIKKFICICIC